MNLVISLKYWELGPAHHKAKARLVALGNRLFDRWMREVLMKEDYRSAVEGLDDGRFVTARSACHRRQSESIDLITAYLQAFLPTDKKIYLIFPEDVIKLLPEEEPALFRALRRAGAGGRCTGWDPRGSRSSPPTRRGR